MMVVVLYTTTIIIIGNYKNNVISQISLTFVNMSIY